MDERTRRNVEIKARVTDLGAVERLVAPMASEGPFDLEQEDTYFRSPNGRLKLRRLRDGIDQLVFYQRPDTAEPKASHYVIHAVGDTPTLQQALSGAMGVRGVVRKRRRVYIVDNTRVHLDEVEGLGTFVELEVVLEEGEDFKQGYAKARALMSALGIDAMQLLEPSYIDLL